MNKINLVSEDINHTIPDISYVFASELRNISDKLRYSKGSDFNLVMDSAYTLVYYAINMCIEYQNSGNGSVPKNIVDEIWVQVLSGGKQVLQICGVEEFNEKVTDIFYTKITDDNIIEETLQFWNIYNL